MRSLSGSVAVVVGVVLAWGAWALAVRVPGKPAKAGCYAVFDVEGGSASGTKVTCADCDASCDIGGPAGQADGQCVFMVRYCLNDTAAAPSCKAAGLKKVRAPLLPPGSLTFPTTASETGCSAATPITVKLKKKGKKKGTRVVTLVAQAAKGTKPGTERGMLVLVCTPHPSGTPCPTTTTTTTTPTVTTTTPSTTSTTSTTNPSGFSKLVLGVTPGTMNCGPAGLTSSPVAPLDGELDDGSGAKIVDLGLGCLYFGGGNNTTVPGAFLPDGSQNTLAITAVNGTTLTLGGAAGPPGNCSLGPLSTSHCAKNPGTSCTSNAQCTAIGDACLPDAQCYFSQPLPIPNPSSPSISTCVQNVVAADESGTVSNYTTTGDTTLSVPLSSRVYLTGNLSSPCPKCMNTTCTNGHCTGVATGKACMTNTDCVNTCNAGRNKGQACTPVGTLQTTLDCPPTDSQFVSPLTIPLSLTTGATVTTQATGLFCPSQPHAGAFGQAATRTIKVTGTTPGDLSDGAAHPSVVAGTFCVPATGNASLDVPADLPGPGAVSIPGTGQLQ